MYSTELIKGTLKTIILKLLSENDKMYGYEITQKVKELSKDKIIITEGALYPLLHKLEDDGIVSTESVYIGKRVRKYYKLTQNGTTITQEMISEFVDFMETMKQIILPPPSLAHEIIR
jgi:PadR family transcriptional regulator, regulatory protein PadR